MWVILLMMMISSVRGIAIDVASRELSSTAARGTLAVSTAFTAEGEAPPVVILHGLLGQARNFRSWATALGPQLVTPRTVHSLDLRNHGESFRGESMTYAEMAGDVLRTLDALGVDRVALIGHSMGGKVAMAAAAISPERVERLGVLDIAPASYSIADGSNWKQSRELIAALAALDVSAFADREAVDNRLARDVLDPNIRAFALSNLSPCANGSGFEWKCDLAAIVSNLDGLARWDADLQSRAPLYEGPTLFLAGAKSRYIRSVHLRDIERGFPRFALRTVAGAGHWIHAEQPQATLEYTQKFLDFEA